MINSDDKKMLVDYAIKLDRDIKDKKKELDIVKAKLQGKGLEELENKNIKFLQYYGDDGSCDVTYRQRCEIDNVEILKEIFGKVVEDKITREEKVSYKIDNKFKDALIALYLKDYNPNDIDSILLGLGLDRESVKLAKKKLNGEYFKDKEFLESLGFDGENLEEELDAIRESINFELISKYIDIENFTKETHEKLKRAITVDENISLGLSYE